MSFSLRTANLHNSNIINTFMFVVKVSLTSSLELFSLQQMFCRIIVKLPVVISILRKRVCNTILPTHLTSPSHGLSNPHHSGHSHTDCILRPSPSHCFQTLCSSMCAFLVLHVSIFVVDFVFLLFIFDSCAVGVEHP